MGTSVSASTIVADESVRLLLEAAPDAMVLITGDGRIALVNGQTEAAFGYSRDELLGQKVEVLMPSRLRRGHVKYRADYLRHPGARPMGSGLELYGRRKDGSEFPIEVSMGAMEMSGDILISSVIRDITERKRAEALSSHLAAMVQASDDAIISKGADGNVMSWNPGAERLYGWTAEEAIGHPVTMMVPGDRMGEFAEILKELRAGRHIQNYETTRLHKDGHTIEVSLTISPVKDNAGAVIGASAIARDITRRKGAEALISHLAALVEASDDAIIGASLDGKITSWNSGAERVYGFKAEEVVGRPLSELISRKQVAQMAGIVKALRHGEHIERFEITQLHRDGHAMEMSVMVSPVKDKAGKVTGASVIARDITLQKRAEEALRQSEERFRVALQNAPVAVFNQDRKLRYTWINSPSLAWGKQDCLGRTDEEIVGGEEGARLMAMKREVLRRGVGARAEMEVTFQGVICYLDLVVEPLRDARGRLRGLTCTATDITPTKKSLLERESLIAKLNEALNHVKLLSGLLSICASCKKITNERGNWEPVESYLQAHSQAKFSHGVCPDCLRKLYPEYYPAEGKSSDLGGTHSLEFAKK